MKTFLFSALVAAAAAAFAAPPAALETHPLTINGKLLGNMVVIQGGIWAIPLDQLAKALGAPITLEPVLSLQGNRLFVKQGSSTTEYKPQKADGSLDAGVRFKYDIKAEKEARLVPGQPLCPVRPGEISSHVTMVSGHAYVPVSDVVRALGDGSVRNFSGNLAPGQSINLNIARNQRGIIAVLNGM